MFRMRRRRPWARVKCRIRGVGSTTSAEVVGAANSKLIAVSARPRVRRRGLVRPIGVECVESLWHTLSNLMRSRKIV